MSINFGGDSDGRDAPATPEHFIRPLFMVQRFCSAYATAAGSGTVTGRRHEPGTITAVINVNPPRFLRPRAV